jgi:hypothetical protein
VVTAAALRGTSKPYSERFAGANWLYSAKLRLLNRFSVSFSHLRRDKTSTEASPFLI